MKVWRDWTPRKENWRREKKIKIRVALTTGLGLVMHEHLPILTLGHVKWIAKREYEVVPGIEPGLQESESWVLTITLHNQLLLWLLEFLVL
ncbi:hypothetical protein BDV38DRAFT_202462 [Aspergillus pseudotamarii]|uniref:Uncharacterized protein n=1 Tax=Aspergillus pseudotamarii TaxID=132259 RepID=A0A5N6SD13_ASPPS|nr:uncharacterized protein BDV38DRAFT_202462 [Aspergillus pseudotamarii]KAE8132608.1 hypothetical protein BDV38DRAFT_202462 [Aspergillus pseudotamarii]